MEVSQKGDQMAHNPTGRRSILSRTIAAMILTCIYCFTLVGATALVAGVSSTSASAQRGRGRGGGGRGVGRGRGGGVVIRGGGRGYGRGRGRGYGVRGGGCVFSPAYGRVVCY